MGEAAVIGGGLAVLAACALWGLICLKEEFGRTRSTVAAVRVWVIYLLHLGLTILAAAWSVWPLPIPGALAVGAGLPLLVFGVALSAAGMFNFGSFKKMSGLDTQRLITDGVYAWSRNPQNVGWAAGLFGIALLGRSGFALAMAAVFAAVFLVYVRFEEKHLLVIFGDEYSRFMRNSPRVFGLPRQLAGRRQSAPEAAPVRDRQVAERV